MNIQIPSFSLNKFLNSPEGGETIPEMVQVLQPTRDITYDVWPVFTNQIRATAFGTVNLVPLSGGPGVYEMRVSFAFTMVNGINAGIVRATIVGDLGNTNMADYHVLLARVAASETFKPAALVFTQLIDLNIATPPGDTMLQLITSGPAAATNIDIACSVAIQRVG